MRDASVAAHGRHVRRVRPAALRRVRGSRSRAGVGAGMPLGGARRRHPGDTGPASVATVAFARRPHGGRVARRRRARDAVPVDEVQHRFRVRRSVGVGGAVVDAHRLRRGDRPGTLVRVRAPGAGGAGRRHRHGDDRRRGLPARRAQPPAVHQAGARAVDRARRRGCRLPSWPRTQAPGLQPHMFDSPLGRRSNRAGHGALDAPRVMCARKGSGWRSRAASIWRR